jgi:peptidyl-tRNA hydrolase
MYCVFSKEAIKKMGGNRGKLAAQAGHAYLHAFWDSENYENVAERYRDSMKTKKVCLVVDTDVELCELYAVYLFQEIGSTIVRDVGLTVFGEETLTCIGIGPIREEQMCEKLKTAKVLI